MLGGCQYKNLKTLTTATLITGNGFLHAVTINTKGATANTLALYDGVDATGVLIGTIDTTAAIGTLHYDVSVGVGLYVALANGTAADVTVSYR
jgi:hypothetical protein